MFVSRFRLLLLIFI